MMKRWLTGVFCTGLVIGTVSAQTFDFENITALKPGGIGASYLNPTGAFALDVNSADAHSGSNSVKLEKDGRITIDFRPVLPGENYRLEAWVKGSGAATVQIEWLGTEKPQNAWQSLKLDPGKYRRIVLDAKAPQNAKHAYLKFYGTPGATVRIDDISMQIRGIDPDAPLLDFEAPLSGPGPVGDNYVNPTGGFEYDDSGKNAASGIGAMKLVKDGRITIDFKQVEPGNAYCLSAEAKGKGRVFVQFQWQGKLEKPQLDSKSIQLSPDRFETVKVQAAAPAGATHVYLHIFASGNESEAWIDNIRMEKVKPDTAPAASLDVRFQGRYRTFSIYPSDTAVTLTVKGQGLLPVRDELEWKLADYRGETVKTGTLAVTAEELGKGLDFTVPGPLKAGEYALHMKLKESKAAIPYRGSRAPGFVAFGILPAIEALPVDAPEQSRFGGQGTNFIASGKFMTGDSLTPFYPTVGMKWTYSGGGGLSELEPVPGHFKPMTVEEYRAKGAPETARLGMAEILDFHGIPRHLLKLPPWVKGDKLNRVQAQSYPLGDPAGFAELIGRVARDRAARKAAFFPSRKSNYYQLHWEPDWHWHGTEEEFMQIYRTAYPAIKANDPDALLLGANYGVISRGAEKMESMFRKGFGKSIDGILIHLYFLPVRDEPEAAGLPLACRKIRRLADRYIRPGAPVINTEWGVDYRGKDTADIGRPDLDNHLSRFLRGHLIALGEGFDGTWFFYTTDYSTWRSTSGEQGYGISYNTSDYIDQHQFGANSIEPKPTMMGAIALTRMLEGTRTLGRLDQLPENVFVYSFRRGPENLLAMWTTDEKPLELTLDTGAETVRLFDCMGNEKKLATPSGKATLSLTRFPQYLLGVADAVLPTAVPRQTATPGSKPEWPGNAAALHLTGNGADLRINAGQNLPDTLPPGVYLAQYLNADSHIVRSALFEIQSPVELGLPEESLDLAGKLQFSVPIANRSERSEEYTIRGCFDGKPFAERPVTLAPHGKISLLLPAEKLDYQGRNPGKLEITAEKNGTRHAEIERAFAVLTAPAAGRITIDGRLSDHPPAGWSRTFGADALTYQAKRHKGAGDFSARYQLLSDADTVYLAVEVRDDVALPAVGEDQPWRNDSLILALGRSFNGKGEFTECRKLAFTRNADGSVRMQEILGTPPSAVQPLPAGTVRCAVRRDEDARQTVYELAIPRKLFSSVNETVGLGITLNDVDSAQEVKDDLHREMSLAGGVPLFMGNIKFATLLLPDQPGNPAEAIWPAARLLQPPPSRKSEFPDSDEPGLEAIIYRGIPTPEGKPTEVFAYYAEPSGPIPEGGFPAVLLIHGGGGTAFAEYVREYVRRGYAVLAPDLYGKRPVAGNPSRRIGLPRGTDEFWQYQGVGNLILAHSLLRSQKNVNPNRTALVGISWGGVFSLIAATLDTRFKQVCAVYGCGCFAAGDASSDFGREMRSEWYDPENFIRFTRIPVFCIIGADDKSFGRDSWLKTVREIPGCRFVLLPELPHSHRGFLLPQVRDVIANAFGADAPPPRFSGKPVLRGNEVAAPLDPLPPGATAQLVYNAAAPDSPVQGRVYHTAPATVAGAKAVAKLPSELREGYLMLTDRNGTPIASSDIFRRDNVK